MDQVIADLQGISFLGIDVITLALWFFVGVVAGGLLPGRRPLGLLGSMLGGVVGGLLAGFVIERFPDLNPAQYIQGLDPNMAAWLGAVIAALVGALIVLLVLRIIIPKR